MTHPPGKSTILIIDDERVILDLTSIILGNRGYKTLTAEDPLLGLQIMESVVPELVLLDYMMPKMDGLTALREIKRRYPDTYVIMFTGKGNEEIAVQLMKAGASDYILKPFNNQDLADRIDQVLRIRRAEISNRELLKERERLLLEIEALNRELEGRVREKSEELQRAHAEVVQSEKLASLGYLSAGMAHEIRNPLNTITLFTHLIRNGIDDPEKLDYMDKIVKEVDRIDAIIRKLLDATRRRPFAMQQISMATLLDDIVDMLKHQFEVNNITLQRDFRRLPPEMAADPTEIEQIFTNLFVNAIQVMPAGGTLRLTLDHNDKELQVSVADTGPGIPRSEQSKIFDPFFTTKETGTGLGLSVVLRIVRNYQGRIDVESDGVNGTLFTVHLPLL